MIRLAAPDILDEDIAAAGAVMRSGFLVQGAHVAEFERAVAEYLGVKHAVACSSGTAALHLAVMALDIGPGDEVIVPDFTFPATASVVARCGATPVLVDIDPATFNADPDAVRAAITARTRAIMPVHLFGLSAEMDPMLALAEEHGLRVIEDAACALGSLYHGRKCGVMGDANCFSFHPRKIITTGEGGMITTNDDGVAERLRLLRNHGMIPSEGSYRFAEAGLNYRLTEFQAVLGARQMLRLESFIATRQRIAGEYAAALEDMEGVRIPVNPAGMRHIWQSYVIAVDDGIDRDAVVRALRDDGVEATIGTHAVSVQPRYASLDAQCPNAVAAYRHTISLPMHTRLTAGDARQVAGALARAVRGAAATSR